MSIQSNKIKELVELREKARLGGGEKAIQKQHDKGKYTARERIAMLLDEGSFEEMDMFVTHRCTNFGMEKKHYLGDGVVTGCGTIGDWATHHLEHELSGMFDVSHGAGLAAMWGSWARYVREENMSRFARFAVNVMGVEPGQMSCEELAEAGIQAMEAFYHSIGMPTSIKELIGKDITDEQIEEMADKCSNYGKITVGALKVLSRDDMAAIYRMAR